MVGPIEPPTLDLDVADLVDWLELSAMFSEFGIARVDALQGSLTEQTESAENNIGERDRQSDILKERIENEIDLRISSLPDAYPFSLSSTGEELEISTDWRSEKYAYYLVCLITTHVTGSPVLRAPPTGELLLRLRNRVFQIVATLGLAGLSVGPAFSVGWPRKSGESITALLSRAVAAGAGFTVRNPPGAYVSPHEKDGGVDVIAWTAEATPPPSIFFYGQTASGKNWPGKPVRDHARVFGNAYLQDHMTGNRSYVTIIPYRVMDDAFWNSQHLHHMAILDRLRLPGRASQGAALSASGVHVDDGGNVAELTAWIDDFVVYAAAA